MKDDSSFFKTENGNEKKTVEDEEEVQIVEKGACSSQYFLDHAQLLSYISGDSSLSLEMKIEPEESNQREGNKRKAKGEFVKLISICYRLFLILFPSAIVMVFLNKLTF